MASRKLLANGAPRLLGNHNTVAGRRFLRAYQALEERYGPFPDQLTRMEAGRAAHAWQELEASTEQLAEARRKLSEARGRYSPAWNPQAIQRLSKRVGLNDATYAAAVRLEEMTAKQRSGPRDLSHLLAPSLARG
jgi:hypothetical protein